jgi:hypothetical protein
MRYKERFILRQREWWLGERSEHRRTALQGANFECVEAGSSMVPRDNKFMNPFTNSHASRPALFFAIALKVFDREGGSAED